MKTNNPTNWCTINIIIKKKGDQWEESEDFYE